MCHITFDIHKRSEWKFDNSWIGVPPLKDTEYVYAYDKTRIKCIPMDILTLGKDKTFYLIPPVP